MDFLNTHYFLAQLSFEFLNSLDEVQFVLPCAFELFAQMEFFDRPFWTRGDVMYPTLQRYDMLGDKRLSKTVVNGEFIVNLFLSFYTRYALHRSKFFVPEHAFRYLRVKYYGKIIASQDPHSFRLIWTACSNNNDLHYVLYQQVLSYVSVTYEYIMVNKYVPWYSDDLVASIDLHPMRLLVSDAQSGNGLYSVDEDLEDARMEIDDDLDFHEVFEMPPISVNATVFERLKKRSSETGMDISNVTVLREDLSKKRRKSNSSVLGYPVHNDFYRGTVYQKNEPGDMRRNLIQSSTQGIVSEKKKNWNKKKQIKSNAQSGISTFNSQSRLSISSVISCLDNIPENEKILDLSMQVSQVASFVMSVIRSKSIQELVLHIVAYLSYRLSKDDISKMQKYFIDLSVTLFSKFFSQRARIEEEVRAQSGNVAGDISNALRSMDTILSAPFIVAVRNLLLISSCVGFLPLSVDKHIFRLFGSLPPPKCGTDLVAESMSHLADIFSHISLFSQHGSFSKLLFGNNPFRDLSESVNYLVNFENLTYTTLATPERICDVRYENLLVSTFNDLTLMKNQGSLPYYQKKKLDDFDSTLRHIIIRRRSRLRGERPVPPAIFLVGRPGVGKTNLVHFITKIWCELTSRDFDQRMIHTYNSSDEFWSGYDPLSQPIIHIPEPANISTHLAAKTGDSSLSMLLQLISSAPMNAQMADIESKGKIFLDPSLVILDGNNPDMHATASVYSPAAVYRRFDFVEVNVKPEYQLAGGVQLDSKKSLEDYQSAISSQLQEDEENISAQVSGLSDSKFATLKQFFLDRYLFTVKRRIAKGNAHYEEQILELNGVKFENVDIFDFSLFLKWRLVDEVAKQTAIKNVMSEVAAKEYIQHALKRRMFPEHAVSSNTPQAQSGNSSFRCHWDSFMYDCRVVWFYYVLFPWTCFLTKLSNLTGYDFGYGYVVPDLPFKIETILPSGWLSSFLEILSLFKFFSRNFLEMLGYGSLAIFWRGIYCFFNIAIHVPFLWPLMIVNSWIYILKPILCPRLVLIDTIASLFILFKMNQDSDIWMPFIQIFYQKLLKKLLFTSLKRHESEAFHRFRMLFHHRTDPFRTSNVPALVFLTIVGVLSAYKVFKYVSSSHEEQATSQGNMGSTSVESEDDLLLSGGVSMAPQVKKEGHQWTLGYNPVVSNVLPIQEDLLRNNSVSIVNAIFKNVRHLRVCGVRKIGSEDLLYGATVLTANKIFKELLETKSDKYTVQHALGLKQDILICNYHAFDPSCDLFYVRLSIPGIPTSTYSGYVYRNHMEHMMQDRVIFRLQSTQFSDITSYFINGPLVSGNPYVNGFFRCGSQYKEISVSQESNILSMQTSWPDNLKTMVDQIMYPLKYNVPNSKYGWCGLPVVVIVNNYTVVAGIHCAGNEGSDICYGTRIMKNELDKAISSLSNKSPYIGVVSQSLVFKGLPARHSLTLKCPTHHSLRYTAPQSVEILGFVSDYHVRMTSSGVSKVKEHWDNNHCLVSDMMPFRSHENGVERYGPPVFGTIKEGEGDNVQYFNPYKWFLSAVGERKYDVPDYMISPVIKLAFTYITKRLKNFNSELKLSPWSLDVAINGVVGDSYIRGISMSTSAGFYFSKNKRNLLVCNEDGMPLFPYQINDEVKKRVIEIIHSYRDGHSANCVTQCALKDEVRSISKNKLAKTRVFCVGDFSMLIVSRMYLGPLFTLMQQSSESFGCAIGINTHEQADKLARFLTGFSDRFMAGDYSEYDTRMPPIITLSANTVLFMLARKYGYDDKQLIIVRGILSDSLFPLYLMDGLLMSSAGSTPSGEYGTAERNSLKGLILLMLGYNILRPTDIPLETFEDNVLPVTYGDDLVAGIKSHICDWFNNVAYGAYTISLGMNYTDPKKREVMVPYCSIEDVTFLKRSFVYNPLTDKWNMPLEWDSIGKSMSYFVRSANVGPSEQRFQTIVSANIEIRVHARTTHFVRRRSSFSTKAHVGELYFVEMKKRLAYLLLRGVKSNQDFDSVMFFDILAKLHRWEQGPTKSLNKQDYEMMGSLYTQLSTELDHSNLVLVHSIAQSGNVNAGDLNSGTNVVAVNETLTTVTSGIDRVGTSSSYEEDQENNVYSISDYFSRPVIIYDGTVAIGSHLYQELNPWNMWSLFSDVRAKLRNFMYFKATLNIRVTFSATPFNYGHILVAYVPYARFNDPLQSLIVGKSSLPEMTTAYLSQGPFVGNIDLRYNRTFEMQIPFICPSNYFRIYADSATAYTTTTEFIDFSAAGALFLRSYNPIRSASDDYLTPVSYNVSVFATDVHLHTPTRTLMALAQSAKIRKAKVTKGKISEYVDPPTVSQMASNVAEAAGILSRIPPLMPFMKPVEYMSGKFSEVAAIFGWSKPLQLEATTFVKQLNYSNQATCIGIDTSQKLSVDPKAGLVVNPGPPGATQDDMAIANIAKREGWIFSAEWNVGAEVSKTNLFMSYVNPSLAYRPSGTLGPLVPSPLYFVTRPFGYWRGSITFIFRIVASQFQRGRFAIIFEPNMKQNAVLNAEYISTATQTSMIVDITDTQEVEFTVEWNSPFEWLRVTGTTANTTVVSGTTITTTGSVAESLGVIRVVPLTQLVSSGNSNPVYINVFVKCDDLEVAYPTNDFLNLGRTMKAIAQSGVVKSTSKSKSSTDRWFGESIVSFRTLLKRFETTARGVLFEPNANSAVIFEYTQGLYPISGNLPWNVNIYKTDGLTSLFCYLRFAFLGMNGGYRYHYRSWRNTHLDLISSVPRPVPNNRSETTVVFTRTPPSTDQFIENTANVLIFDQIAAQISVNPRGSVVYDLITNSGAEIELPSYSAVNFFIANSATNGARVSGTAMSGSKFGDGFYMPPGYTGVLIQEFSPGQYHAGGKENQWCIDGAAAEDFSFYTFMGSPAVISLS
ncbi:hypothetical protein [Wenzhou picorna-like virus 23]|uniref:hypothetical protein n=1 Tax=Wenzhou picorna-like virus 23 TaxID=1923608 RepID=UPI00090BA593|nr:hypothetical protein [Wenzhou picorna-like virus 23]APG78497.1 hypothetical protein [Wenzhou picorna-like virus 23]